MKPTFKMAGMFAMLLLAFSLFTVPAMAQTTQDRTVDGGAVTIKENGTFTAGYPTAFEVNYTVGDPTATFTYENVDSAPFIFKYPVTFFSLYNGSLHLEAQGRPGAKVIFKVDLVTGEAALGGITYAPKRFALISFYKTPPPPPVMDVSKIH
jgi:hypothetical protein